MSGLGRVELQAFPFPCNNLLRKLITDESMLSPRGLVEGERDIGVVERFADQVTAFWWNVGVFLAEDLRSSVRKVM